eukprot:jgi/Ulvmu1/3127/UM015_0167.1
MAKGKKKKKAEKAKLGVAGDVEMKTNADKAETEKIQPKSIDELIELAQSGALQQPAAPKAKQAPRGKRSKVQKQRKVELLEKALSSSDKAGTKVVKGKMKAKKKAALSNLW